jgi:aconitate hydratase
VAAIAPLALGIRAVVAKSFARIHRRNLICQGIVPLTFADEVDADGITVGDTWRIEGAREAIESGAEEVAADAGGRRVGLRLALSHGEREMLLAGGLLALLRSRAVPEAR